MFAWSGMAQAPVTAGRRCTDTSPGQTVLCFGILASFLGGRGIQATFGRQAPSHGSSTLTPPIRNARPRYGWTTLLTAIVLPVKPWMR